MQVLENKEQWSADYQNGWLAKLKQTGTKDWSIYTHPKNSLTPGSPGVTLSKSRLMLISSAGAVLPDKQKPFDAVSAFGDYSIRTIPSNTPFQHLAYFHDHYDHQMINQDPQSSLPLGYLREMVATGAIGSVAPSVVSFMGYQPDAARVVDETVPEVIAVAESEGVQAALLAPV